MPQLKQAIPKYRKHRASKQAIVTLGGKDFYLGPHGCQTSKDQYDRLISRVCLPISLPISAKARHVDYPGFCSLHASRIREVLLRVILNERDREIAGWARVPMAWGGRQRAMEAA